VLANGAADDWVVEVAEAVGEQQADVAPAVESFVADMKARGLLV
jgi:hypothetical protein